MHIVMDAGSTRSIGTQSVQLARRLTGTTLSIQVPLLILR